MERDTALRNILRTAVDSCLRGATLIQPYDITSFYLDFLVYLNRIQKFFYSEEPDELPELLEKGRSLLSDYSRLELDQHNIGTYLRNTIIQLQHAREPWRSFSVTWINERISRPTNLIPGMLYPETKQYYKWLGKNYSGYGEVIELGCWLGSSTACLLEGLSSSDNFRGHKLNVFDSFTWEKWMDTYVLDMGLPIGPFASGESFLNTFMRNCIRWNQLLDVNVCQIHYPRQKKKQRLSKLKWDGGPIELLVNDFSHDDWVTREIWKIFSPSFIPGRTIIVYNQYANKNAVALRQFISTKLPLLMPLHKPHASTKAFLFRGANHPTKGQSI
jgi:hypothetical protein